MTTTTYRIADGWNTEMNHKTGYSPLRHDAERVMEIVSCILAEVTAITGYADAAGVEFAIDEEIKARPEHYGMNADLLKVYRHLNYSVQPVRN